MSARPSSLIDSLARRWWFFLLIILVFFFPAYTTHRFNPAETPQLVIEVLSHALAFTLPALFPFFKLVPLALITGLVLLPVRTSRWFYAWAGVNLLVVAVFQNMANTQTYGFAVLVGNLIVYGLTGLVWIRAALGPNGNRLNLSLPLPWWRYWVVPLALLAYWYPVSTSGAVPIPDFAPLGLVANEAGLTFCMMMPVYLAVLTLAYPEVDPTVLRISAFIGLFTGALNVAEFLLIPIYGPWMAILHLPLLLISLYAFALSLRKNTRKMS
jgi:hypothetical protein